MTLFIRPHYLINKMSAEEAKQKILDKIKYIEKSTGKRYRFISFVNDEYLGIYKTNLIVQDLSIGEIKEISYSSFMKHNGWSNKLERIRIPEETAIKRINRKIEDLGNNVEFIDFVGGKWIGVENSRIILKSNVTGETGEIKYRSFLGSGWTPDSEKLRKLEKSRSVNTVSKENAIINIKNKLKIINRGIDFIGFKDNKWEGTINSTIILKNSEGENHEMLYGDFMRARNTIGWKFSCESFHYITENICMKIIENICNCNVVRQFKIRLPSEKIIKVDFYLPERKEIIEYDGSQHYRWEPYIHKTYNRFVDQVNRDNALVQYCKENSIQLLRIPWKDNSRLEEIIHAFLLEGKDISTHIQPKLLPVPMSYYGQNTINRS